REVRVGYVVETPVWKTSYRLVLDPAAGGKPYLQGWAVVENPTDEDWSAVRMALVSGRPISFRMDLYNPLYVPRPVVEPERFASLRPPTYDGGFGRNRGELALKDMQESARQAGEGEGLQAAGFAGRSGAKKGAAVAGQPLSAAEKSEVEALRRSVEYGAPNGRFAREEAKRLA